MKILKNIILLGLVVFSISKVVFAEVDYYNQVVFLKAKRNLLNIDPSIEHIDFDLTKYHTSLNDSILKNTLVKKAIKYNGLTVENFQDKVQFSIEFKRLITKRKPLQIERIFDPPFDTLRKDFRGKLVKVPDLSLHYKIIFQNKNDQVNFIKEIREFIGVLNVEKPIPPEFIQKDSNVPPGEEFYQNQWYLNEPNGAQVESAWEIQRDNEDVIIHINEIGGGGSLTSLNHEDLNANIIHSDIAPSDDHFIRVTGVASAVTDNNTGIAGTAYNSKIYLTVSPENDYVAAANYLKAAADYQPHEIRIANFSWHMQYHSQALYDACQYAYNDGMFLVCSGGNDSGRDDNNYPPNYDQYIMAVSATNENGSLAGFSTYGEDIDLAAPGDHIYSTKQNGYEYSEGTSFSSPLVAGIAALLISKNPNLTPEEIRTILEETALDKGASGRDDKYGWGIVQADAALLHVPLMHSTISSALSAASSGQKITVSPGAYTESTDLTVPTGVTLDMTAGGTLQMADDKQIIVNGTLNAKNATFTASANDWGGIRFNSGSGGEIYNCSLYKCGYPYYIYIYNASPTIQANTLSQWAGAYNGIYVRGSNADPTLYDNDIEINYTGVRFDNYAAGELSYNLIHVTNMYDPVLYAVGGAWVDADYRGANTFREGRYGIAAQSSARVDASGTFSENDFCETGVYDLYATSSSSIYANYCNFPGASPATYTDGTSTITTQYASNSDGYCSQLSKANTLAGLESPRGEPLHPVDVATLSPLDRAWNLLKTDQVAAAEAAFLALLKTERAHQALTGIAHIYTRNQSPAIFNAVTKLAAAAGPLQAHAMEVESHCYVVQGAEQKALTTAKELAERFPESEYGFQSRITAMYMHYHRGELAPAAELLAHTAARNETDAATIRMIHHVLERAGANVTALAVEKPTSQSDASHPWDETVVVAPNPYDVGSGTQALQFFHLPTHARIQLYDVAGRHRLTTASQGANTALTLSAQDYPAGVYLYVVEELDGADGAPTGKRTTGKFVIIQ